MERPQTVCTGGITIPIYHCIFNQGSITHFLHEIDSSLTSQLPNLYAVCVARKVQGRRNVVAGFFIKTSYTHHDQEFAEACRGAIAFMDEIRPLLGEEFSLLPARVSMGGKDVSPLTEEEMNAFIFQQYFKFHEMGQA